MADVQSELRLLPPLLCGFCLTRGLVERTISGCPGAEYFAEFLFEHTQLETAVIARLRSLMVLQDRRRYTFRMYDAPTLGDERTVDYEPFVESICLV